MIQLKDTDTNWAFTWPGKSLDVIYYEDGTRKKLRTEHLMVVHGKYAGMSLNEVSDVNYLKYMVGSAKEKKDVWMEHVLSKRLKELV